MVWYEYIANSHSYINCLCHVKMNLAHVHDDVTPQHFHINIISRMQSNNNLSMFHLNNYNDNPI